MIRDATEKDYPYIKSLLLKHFDKVGDDYSHTVELDFQDFIVHVGKGFMAAYINISRTIADAHVISETGEAFRMARKSFRKLRHETDIRSLIAHIPVYNERCFKFAKYVGFKEKGINERSILKNGKYHDQYLLTRSLWDF